MRIGISCYPTFGGSGIVATELAMSLAAAGDDVHVISYAMPSRLSLARPNLSFHQVVVPDYPLFEYPPYSLALASKIAELARFQGLEIVHVHYAVPNAVSAVLARQILAPRRLPVVTTLHGTDVTLIGNDPSYLETTRWAVRESDAVTAVSAWLRDATEQQLGLEDHPIEVIPNFVDPERYERVRGHPGARRWAKPGEKIILHVSNFRPVKRVMDVLEIFLRIRKAMPARLLLVGDGPDRAKLEQRCRAEGCCDVVTFLGQLQAVEEVVSGADLFLLPSENESFGLAGLEALACEVPVVGARVGGIPEVVEDGSTGLLFPVGDVAAMAAGAIALLSDPERHRAFARRAREQAIERFAEVKVVAQYRALYERVLAKDARAGAAALAAAPGTVPASAPVSASVSAPVSGDSRR